MAALAGVAHYKSVEYLDSNFTLLLPYPQNI